jgi:hypothetical protein
VIVEFFERDVQARCEGIIKHVIDKALGLRLPLEKHYIIHAARDHGVKNSPWGDNNCCHVDAKSQGRSRVSSFLLHSYHILVARILA